MTNHPNRSRAVNPASNPSPDEIISLRNKAHLTQTEAAKLIYAASRTWQHWEAGEIRMHPGLWELFQIKVGERI